MRRFIDIVKMLETSPTSPTSPANRSKSILREFRHQLDEGAKDRYAQMFQAFEDDVRQEAMKVLDWAMKKLRREDRVIWYLRLYRINLLQTLLRTGKIEDDKKPKMEKTLEKWVREVAAKSGESVNEVRVSAAEIKTKTRDLEHIASMFPTVQKMDAYQWGSQSVTKLVDDMQKLEQEWREEIDSDERSLTPTEADYDDSEKIIDFSDGFAWWSLGVNYCRREGDSMGHCGNSASYAESDVVLSLRRRVNGRDVPFLTFILDRETGLLGEMKGRANEKPAPRYHRYIIDLLRHSLVKGIKGGGHAPENNFTLSDLPRDIQDSLIIEKPELAEAEYLYNRYGSHSEEFRAKLKLEIQDFIYEYISNDGVVVSVGTPRDLSEVTNSKKQNTIFGTYPNISRLGDWLYEIMRDFGDEYYSSQTVRDFFQEIYEEDIIKIGNYLAEKYKDEIEEFDKTSWIDVLEVFERVDDAELETAIRDAMRDGFYDAKILIEIPFMSVFEDKSIISDLQENFDEYLNMLMHLKIIPDKRSFDQNMAVEAFHDALADMQYWS